MALPPRRDVPLDALITERPRVRLAAPRWWHAQRLAPWFVALVVGLLVLIPIAMLVFASVRGPVGALPTLPRAFYTLDHYREALFRVSSWRMALETGLYIVGSVSVSLVFGASLAWLTERVRIPKPNVAAALVVLPFLLPPSLVTGAWLTLFRARSGTVNVFLRDNFFGGLTSGPIDTANIPAMALAQGLFMTPIAFLIVAAALRNMGGALEEVSFTSGAGPLTTVRRITVPMLFPALFTAAVLGVWFTLDWTDVPFDLGAVGAVRLFSIRLYFQTIGSVGGFPNFGGAAAHGVLMLVVLAGLFALYARQARHGARFATAGLPGSMPRRWQLGRWAIPLLALAVFYLLAMWLAPMYRLADGVVTGGPAAFETVLSSRRFWSVALNTMVIAGGSATLGTLVVVAVAWVVVRSDARWLRRPLDIVATAPLVVPGQLAASAFLLAYLVIDWLPLWGTHLGVLLALAFRLAIPYRLTNAGMRQITRDMDDASAASGAAPLATLRDVLVPMLLPTIAASWIIFFVFAVRERSIVQYVGYQVRTFTTIGNLGGPPGTSAVASLLSILMVVGVIVLVRYALLGRRSGRGSSP